MQLHFAPLQGYTDNLYRQCHAQVYGAADAYYTPFLRVEKGAPRRQDLTRLESAAGDGTPLVTQVIFRDYDEFGMLTDMVRGLGYRRIDLNLGCPYPMQTRKGRGAAMITDLAVMEQVCRHIADDTDTVYSVKMRLGLESPEGWRQLMPLLNDTPLGHITVHPRVATQMYGGEMYADEFEHILQASKNPVIWNGDIATRSDITSVMARYPSLHGVMIGRGLLARPSLIDEWRAGREYSREERVERILRLHEMLYDGYRETLCGPAQILQKVKPFWDYLEPEIGHKAAKLIHKAGSLARYDAAVASIG